MHNSHFKMKVSLEDHRAQTEDLFLSRKTDRLHDLRLFSSDWRSCISKVKEKDKSYILLAYQ